MSEQANAKTLLAAGLNAHQQLLEKDGDLVRFTDIEEGVVEILLSTWSTLSVKSSKTIVSSGHRPWIHPFEEDISLHSAIGDHNGFKAVLDDDGQMYSFSGQEDVLESHLERANVKSSPSLSFLAMAGNGKIAVVHKQAPKGNLADVREFGSFEAFRSWHREPSDPKYYPSSHHMIPGRPRQLNAGTGSFAMLMDNNDLYTWGDPRHRSLARSTAEPDAVPAHRPGLVDALAGLKIRKIALGGWMGGAVSEDGAAYIWGTTMPGKQHTIQSLHTLKRDERVALVSLDDSAEEPDVIDLAIGDGHAALVTADGRAFVVGENKHGQLGLGLEDASVVEWTQVPGIDHAMQVVCGPKSTFLWIDR